VDSSDVGSEPSFPQKAGRFLCDISSLAEPLISFSGRTVLYGVI
jgi:hypothetical protein